MNKKAIKKAIRDTRRQRKEAMRHSKNGIRNAIQQNHNISKSFARLQAQRLIAFKLRFASKLDTRVNLGDVSAPLFMFL